MKRIACPIVFLFVCVTLLAAPAPKPNVRVEFPRYVYGNVVATSLEAINFRKFEFREFSGKRIPAGIRLADGKASVDYPGGGTDEIMLRRVSYFGGTAKSPKYAVAEFMHFAAKGSSKQDAIVQVFGLQDDHPVLLQQIVFDAQAEGWGIDFDAATATLDIRGRAEDGTPHCCPKFLDVVRYKWRGDRFVRTAYERQPTSK
jgi:hypothetical protein